MRYAFLGCRFPKHDSVMDLVVMFLGVLVILNFHVCATLGECSIYSIERLFETVSKICSELLSLLDMMYCSGLYEFCG